MTEKRFQYNVNKNTIEENEEFVAYVNSVDGVRIANKLNALQEENEQLKQQNKKYMFMMNCNSDLNDEIYQQLKKTEKNYKSLLKENEQLKHDATVLICSNQEYRKENEQLKQEINMLKTTIERNEAYIDRLTHKSEWGTNSNETD